MKIDLRRSPQFEGLTADHDVLRALGRGSAALVDATGHIIAVCNYDRPIPYCVNEEQSGEQPRLAIEP